jgi:hypothetical protein
LITLAGPPCTIPALVDLAAVADSDDEDEQHVVVDLVHDPIVKRRSC